MNRKTPHDHNYTASKPSLPRSETIGKIGSDPVSLKKRRNVSEDMAVTESITIDLAEIGAAVPDGTTVEIAQVAPQVYRCERNGVGYEVEVGWRTGELTLADEGRPERVPDWLEAAMAEAVGIDEVTL